MATNQIGWAPANQWFSPGFKKLKIVDLEGVVINILPHDYFLATKFSAYYDRGGNDPRLSHDFEDIVYILNHTSTLKEIVEQSESEVRDFLLDAFQKIIQSEKMQEAIIGNLYFDNQSFHFEKIMKLLNEIIQNNG